MRGGGGGASVEIEKQTMKDEKVSSFGGMSGPTFGVEQMHDNLVALKAQLVTPE